VPLYFKESSNPSSKAELTTGHGAFRRLQWLEKPPRKFRKRGGATLLTISSFYLAAKNKFKNIENDKYQNKNSSE